MELRHLRYFIAVAEEGSFTTAAERRLHTAQPSLSRQMRDLETEVGVALFERQARGVALTAAGKAFLDQARLALLQVEAAGEAARRAARPGRAAFVLGFLTGHELDWLPQALEILRAEEPDLAVTVVSDSSPALAGALLRGAIDAAVMRREAEIPGLAFRTLDREPLSVVLPIGHRLAAAPAIRPGDLEGESFIMPTRAAPALKRVLDDYLARSGVTLSSAYEAENLAMATALVVSTGGVTILPRYVQRLLPPTLVSRPLLGEAPQIEVVLGSARASSSARLKRFLVEMTARAEDARRERRGR